MKRWDGSGLPEETFVERLFGILVILIVISALWLITAYMY